MILNYSTDRNLLLPSGNVAKEISEGKEKPQIKGEG